MAQENNGLLWTVLIVAAISVLFSGLVFFGGDNTPEIPAPQITAQDKAEIAQLVISNLPSPQPQSPPINPNGSDSDSDDGITDEDREYLEDISDLDEEREAERLAKDELDSKDFKRDLQDFLNEQLAGDNPKGSSEIESYRDIEDIDVKDMDVDVDGDEATVEFEIKVSYFLDGDDDEEDLEKAKLYVTMFVEDLDSDDDFEDAEVIENYEFDFIKFYEK